MSAPKITPAQVSALRLASVEPIRYYLGGYYTTATHGGPDQRAMVLLDTPTTTPGTLRALCVRGLMHHSARGEIYYQQWKITDAGRDVIAALDDTKETP